MLSNLGFAATDDDSISAGGPPIGMEAAGLSQNTLKAWVGKGADEIEEIIADEPKRLVLDDKLKAIEKREELEMELGVLKGDLDKLKANYSEAEKELEIMKKDETSETRKSRCETRSRK